MPRGPKPKPMATKILDGVHPFRINRDEPQYGTSPGLLDPPTDLRGLALVHWNEIVPVLSRGRVLTDSDRPNLILLCELYARWRGGADDNQAVDKYIRLSCEFGMTPSSRSRIKVVPEAKDELAAFLDRKQA